MPLKRVFFLVLLLSYCLWPAAFSPFTCTIFLFLSHMYHFLFLSALISCDQNKKNVGSWSIGIVSIHRIALF